MKCALDKLQVYEGWLANKYGNADMRTSLTAPGSLYELQVYGPALIRRMESRRENLNTHFTYRLTEQDLNYCECLT